nr:ribonuclease H-like domain, reverse transcriptase, RNA-dependent DNA polymerase [Tanacetum cinerariifolium]
MAALQYKAKHKKVRYLLKPNRSDDYHNIIDFLHSSHIREPELDPPAILATIDRTPYTITEELIRSSLQLTDDGGVTDLPILKIYSRMDALCHVTKGEGTEVAAQDVPHPVLAPDQSLPHLTTPSRPQSPNPVALVLEHDHSSAQPDTTAGSFPSIKDAPLGSNFHTSPTRSSHTSPANQPLGCVEDLITLTTLSSVVSTLVQKVHSLEVELHDHKKRFKDVVGKLVKKDKSLEVKLKTKKRKIVVSKFDEEDVTTPNVDLDALRALANASVAVDLDVPPGSKSLMVEEDIPVLAMTFRQMEEDRLEFEKIHKVQSQSQLQAFGQTLKRPGSVLEEPPTKKPKSPEAPTPSIPEVPISHAVTSPPSSCTRRKSLGHRHEGGIDYDEVFAPVARIKTIRLFLAFASYMGFLVYQMDVKSAFLYESIKEEVYVTQPKGFVDPQHPKKVYKEWCDEFEALMKGEFQMSGTATTPYKALKPKSKRESDSPVNVHLYRSMIGSLMYLTASMPDIMFAASACSRHQVTPNTSNLEAIKKIFKYLKGQPKLELASPEQTATSKDIPNPFMAVMICQKSLGYSNSPLIHVLRVRLVINPPG